MMGRKFIRSDAVCKLIFKILRRKASREELYDRLYSLNWGDTTTNNYGYAPAEGHCPERFQLQLYTELLRLLENKRNYGHVSNALEISCGRGGGLCHLARHLSRQSQVVGFDYSSHAIEYCRRHYGALPNFAFVRGHALQLPFGNGSFDLVVNVEASHAYGNDAAFLLEVRRVLHPQGRFLYADYRTRSKVPKLERAARAAGLLGELSDITRNVVASCELDAERRRQIIRSGLPWYTRPLVANGLESYSGVPGTNTFERFRSGDRMYFISCMEPCSQQVDTAPPAAVPAWRLHAELPMAAARQCRPARDHKIADAGDPLRHRARSSPSTAGQGDGWLTSCSNFAI